MGKFAVGIREVLGSPTEIDVNPREDNSVLVVDNEADIRSAIRELLRDEGFVAIEAGNGRLALDYLLATRTTPRLILVDMHMPVMSGLEMIKVLRNYLRFVKIPIVMVTGEPRLMSLADDDAIAGWLPKPIDPDALLAVVREHVPLTAR